MALTHTAIEKAKTAEKQYRLTDGQGLYLLVMPGGQKHWRFDYTLHGKRKTFAVGPFPVVSLKSAREIRDSSRKLVAEGIDPVQHRQEEKALAAAAANNIFGRLAEEWFAKMSPTWSAGHAESIRQRLDNHILPHIGNVPLADLNPLKLLPVLRRLEQADKIESAKRVRIILGQIFRYGISCGVAERDPAADLKGALAPPRPKRMAAVATSEQAGGLLRAISSYQGDIITRLALRFSALTFARPGEVRHAEWREIDFNAAEWRIPGEKMKMRRDHVVPLADQTISLLRQLYQITGVGKYLFPSLRSSLRPMSENTIVAALRRMGYSPDEMTAHGFRSMASTLLHENGHDPMVIEMQLAHRVGSAVASIYNRSERLKDRHALMRWWADYLDQLEHCEPEEVSNGGR